MLLGATFASVLEGTKTDCRNGGMYLRRGLGGHRRVAGVPLIVGTGSSMDNIELRTSIESVRAVKPPFSVRPISGNKMKCRRARGRVT